MNPAPPGSRLLRVGILEDYRLILESLAGVMAYAGFEVCLATSSVSEFLQEAVRAKPDVVVIDLSAEAGAGVDGIDVVRELKVRAPDTRAVVLSTGSSMLDADRGWDTGVFAYLDKRQVDTQGLVNAVSAAARGERRFPVALARLFTDTPTAPREPHSLERLTHREREVLSFVGLGADNLKIAANLCITERTVKAHVSSLYRKLGSENRAELALLARELGLVRH
jgi:DNA-binding NarL/FixJ family response regulator